MIARMKKLSLIVYHNSKEKFLKNLQDLGLVHLEVNASVENERIIYLKDEIQKYKKAENLLIKIGKEIKKTKPKKKLNLSLDETINNLNQEYEKLNQLNSLKEQMQKEIDLIYPWSDFEPENINRLINIGIDIKFYSMKKSKFKKFDKSNLAYEVINIYKGVVYFVVFYNNGESCQELSANEIKLPIKSLDRIYGELEKINEDIFNQEKILAEYTGYLHFIQEHLLELDDKLSYSITDASLIQEAQGAVLIITGWFPKDMTKKVINLLNREDVVYLIEDPSPNDNVPVLLKNDPFSKLFEPITNMHSLPQYNEVDPTPFFAPFFALFFGLCLADVGYGFILLIGVIIALIFIRSKNLRPILLLGLVISLTTIFGGYILDTFFGVKISEMEIIPASLKKGIVYGDMYQAMGFALILGIIQVFIGFILQSVNRYKKYGFFGFLQPISIIMLVSGLIILVMPFLSSILGTGLSDLNAGPIKLGYWISLIPDEKILDQNKYGVILSIVGIVLLLLFNNLETKIFLRPLRGLWELYGVITGVPGDILSYIRLFALGLAGSLLGNAFNKIAFMLRDSIPIIPLAYLGMILIMVVGHGLNMALAALSAFVHPLRLILLEFYKSVSFEGGGLVYSPFKNKILNKNK
jgi:V/A-type H+-transporting ATPase subunit I